MHDTLLRYKRDRADCGGQSTNAAAAATDTNEMYVYNVCVCSRRCAAALYIM